MHSYSDSKGQSSFFLCSILLRRLLAYFCSLLYFWSINPDYFLLIDQSSRTDGLFLLHLSSSCPFVLHLLQVAFVTALPMVHLRELCAFFNLTKVLGCTVCHPLYLLVSFLNAYYNNCFSAVYFLLRAELCASVNYMCTFFWMISDSIVEFCSVYSSSKHGVRCGLILTMSKLFCKDMRTFTGYKLQV